ncbi:hypothetical protein HPB52_021372 [Rhipicephalus sanguineus]|uniref:BEN domain-containing protein n=1 Tax=Rhipicephalus sanguineus TaxID=34632 RepID=A0A9D4PM68_RHISA|nr:hypothetical protein HPB52_021372 [Rhipicephalus sanguineus]
MYAYVRFVEEIGNSSLYTIPAKDILNFHPKDVNDFDNRTTYTACWHDEANEENSGEYVIQILKLAASKKEMQQQLALKRPQIPKLNPSVVESEEEEQTQTKTKTARRELHKQKQTAAATKKEQYNKILAKYSEHMSQNVADAAKISKDKINGPVEGDLPRDQKLPREGSRKPAAAPGKKKSSNSKHTESSSDSDDSVAPASKLKSAKQEARFWRSQCMAERKLTVSLKEEINFLRSKIVDQLTQFQETLQAKKDEPDSESVKPAAPPPFSETSDGRFHLCNEVYTTSVQAAKLFSNKKPTILVREAAQLIWGIEVLAQRSISGKMAPTKQGEGGLPCKQLSPEKLDVVYACLSHWGQLNKVDTAAVSQKVLRTLSEKIQDVKKKLRFEK